MKGESPPTVRHRAVIVGGGPSGLAVAAELLRRGIAAPVLEQGERPGWAWSRHYDGLRLHTVRGASHLPGRRLPRTVHRYPGRDDLGDYLRAYAARLDLRTGVRVRGVEPAGPGWRVRTEVGVLDAAAVVLATGSNREPVVPELPGRERFGGEVVHSSAVGAYRRFDGRRVLVVGLGNSGGDLAAMLHGAGARVTVAVRGAVHPVPLEVLGVNWRTLVGAVPFAATAVARRLGGPVEGLAWRASAALWDRIQRAHAGDLEARGVRLSTRDELIAAWRAGRPPLTTGDVLELVRAAAIEVVPTPTELEPGAAVLPDGRRLPVDIVVLATGFRPALEELVPPGVAADLARDPLRDGGVPGHRGLYLCGFQPELLRIRRAARRIARELAADRCLAPSPAPQ